MDFSESSALLTSVKKQVAKDKTKIARKKLQAVSEERKMDTGNIFI